MLLTCNYVEKQYIRTGKINGNYITAAFVACGE